MSHLPNDTNGQIETGTLVALHEEMLLIIHQGIIMTTRFWGCANVYFDNKTTLKHLLINSVRGHITTIACSSIITIKLSFFTTRAAITI